MKVDLFGDVSGLSQSLDFHLQRHGVLAANLANADTPNYVPRDLVYTPALGTPKVARTDAQHMGGSPAETRYALETMPVEPHRDGNGVEIEQAMAQVQANRLRYETGLELTRRRLAALRYAAMDGSGT